MPYKSKATSRQDKVNTTAHLIETTGHHLAHTVRHAKQLKKSKTKSQRDFNHEHMATHLKGAVEHVQKLMDHVKTNYPGEAKELQTIENTVPSSTPKKVAQMMRKHL